MKKPPALIRLHSSEGGTCTAAHYTINYVITTVVSATEKSCRDPAKGGGRGERAIKPPHLVPGVECPGGC